MATSSNNTPANAAGADTIVFAPGLSGELDIGPTTLRVNDDLTIDDAARDAIRANSAGDIIATDVAIIDSRLNGMNT
jgi:hypothetical protein